MSLDHRCQWCGLWFKAKRADARYCSSRCRTAKHRRRKRDATKTAQP